MAEPARKLEYDIEPDIKPSLRVIDGGGNTTPERASLKTVNDLESNPEKVNKDSVSEQEENGSVGDTWKNKYTGEDNKRGTGKKTKGIGKLLKGKGPMGVILSIILGGGFGLSMLFSPSLLLVHLKETLTEKFNLQLTSMDIRTTKILTKKMGTTTGLCGSVITIKCKYSTMSEKQIKNFEKAGIKVLGEEKNILGRTKPTGFEFEGGRIDAADFNTVINKNPKFRSALKLAYNPKFAGFTDAVWKKAASFLKISKKAPPIEGETFEEKTKSVSEDIKESTKIEKTPVPGTDEINPETNEYYTDTEIERIKQMNELADLAGSDTGTVSKIMNGASEVVDLVKITGLVDDACTLYRTFKAIGYAAKAVRVIQLASYAMLFLRIADQIKAGDANPEDVSFLGTVLNTQSLDDFGNAKTATDSFGYKYATYNETSDMPTSAMQYMAAAGVAGFLVNVLEKAPATVKSTCNFLGNPIVGLVSFLLGLGAAIFTGGQTTAILTEIKVAITAAAKTAYKNPSLMKGLALALGEVFLPSLLKDIVAGNLVDETTVGANAGDAITSGASGIMGTAAKYGGNAPLTVNQAVAYDNLSKKIAMQYAEEDRLNSNPFDASNKNTFMGSIVSSLIPYVSKMSSVSSTLSSIASISFNPFSFLSPQLAYATGTAEEFSMCQDYDYRELNLATDPYCNIRYGIPTDDLEKDPIKVVDELLNVTDPVGGIHPQIDSSTGEPIDVYTKFVGNCMNREEPFSPEPSDNRLEDSSSGGGDSCLFGEYIFIDMYQPPKNEDGTWPDPEPFYIPNNNFYLHFIDQRIENGMEAY